MKLLKWLVIASLGIAGVIFISIFFNPGIFITHDGTNHIARFASYITAINDGHIPPRWAGGLNYSYGTPVFNFFYPLPYIIASLFYLITPNLELIFKIISFGAFVLAPVTFYHWINKYLSKDISFAISVMYGVSLYHIANLFVRGDIGELLSIIFVPLVFHSIDSIRNKVSVAVIITGSLAYGLSLLSHNGVSLFFTPIYIGYILVIFLSEKSLKSLLQRMSIIIAGLCLSAFFWIPALIEKKYTNISLFTGNFYHDHFLSVNRIVTAPWGFNPNANSPGGIAPQLGIIPFVIFLYIFIYIIIKNQYNNKFLFWTTTLGLSIFLMLPISDFLWQNISFLRIIQFPWRFMSVANFALFASIASCAIILKKIQKSLIYCIIIISCLSTIPYIKVSGYRNFSNSSYFSFPDTTYFHGEATTIWSTGDFSAFPITPVFVSDGTAEISNYSKKTSVHTYNVNANTKAQIVDNTLYWPGWKVWVDNKKTPIEFQNQNHRGLITYTVAPGDHSILVRFTETPLRIISNGISSIMICSIFIYFLIKKFYAR